MQKKNYKKLVSQNKLKIEEISEELAKPYPNLEVVDANIQNGFDYIAIREEEIKKETKALAQYDSEKKKIFHDFLILLAIYTGVFGIVLGEFGLLFNWLLSSKMPLLINLVIAIGASFDATFRIINRDYPYLKDYFKAKMNHRDEESLIAERLSLQSLETALLRKRTVLKWKKRNMATEDKVLSNRLKETRNDACFELEFYENEKNIIDKNLDVLACAKVAYYVELLYNALEEFNSVYDIAEKRKIAKDINSYIKILLEEYKSIENPEYGRVRKMEAQSEKN